MGLAWKTLTVMRCLSGPKTLVENVNTSLLHFAEANVPSSFIFILASEQMFLGWKGCLVKDPIRESCWDVVPH